MSWTYDNRENVWKLQEGGILGKISNFIQSDRWKPQYWNTQTYEAPSLKEALFKAYANGMQGQNIMYNGKAYKVALSPQDTKEFETRQQHERNRSITPEQVVDSYISNAMYVMENPTKKGFKNGKWYPYTDKDAQGNTHINIGPGINSKSDMGTKLNYSGKVGYTTDELNAIVRPDLLKKMQGINTDLQQMMGADADTMSLGNRMIFLDISHNVRPKGSKRANMPMKWPALAESMSQGDTQSAIDNMNSGSTRRKDMRSDLLWKNVVEPNTVKNR